jgi:hypothetical protein
MVYKYAAARKFKQWSGGEEVLKCDVSVVFCQKVRCQKNNKSCAITRMVWHWTEIGPSVTGFCNLYVMHTCLNADSVTRRPDFEVASSIMWHIIQGFALCVGVASVATFRVP